MSEKIYIVTAGSYSEYHIERVFKDKKKAEAFSKLYDQKCEWGSDKSEVEEFEFSDENYLIRKDKVVWKYEFVSGWLVHKCKILRSEYTETSADGRVTNVMLDEDDEEKAKRVYREKKYLKEAEDNLLI